MERFGPLALHLHNAAVHVGFIAYVGWRIVRREAPILRVDEPVTVRSVTS